MRLNLWHNTRGAKQRALLTVSLLLYLFVALAFTVWQANPTIHFLGNIALGGALFLQGVIIRSGRRAARAAGKRLADYSEYAGQLVRMEKKVGIGLVLLGLIVLAAVSLSWTTRIFVLAIMMIGILFISDSFNRFMGIVGFVLVPLNVFFIGCLYLDAVHGYDKVWPVYTFVACGLVSLLVWPYLLWRALFKWVLR